MKTASTVTIVGIGMIGGSYGLAMRERGLADEIIGVARRESTLKAAIECGACDQVTTDLATACRDSDLILLCAPVSSIPEHARTIAGSIRPGTIVTDAGSTKGTIVRECEAALGERVHFVGGHPMAGSEKTGVQFARANLFESATYVLTPTEATHPQAIRDLTEFVEALGARPLLLDPGVHDSVVALTSHLPHCLAFALVNAVWNGHHDKSAIVKLAATSFRDATRVAESSASLWTEILLENRDEILRALELLERETHSLREALLNHDKHAIEQTLLESNLNLQRIVGNSAQSKRGLP